MAAKKSESPLLKALQAKVQQTNQTVPIERPTINPEVLTLDPSRLRLVETETRNVVIDFENVQGAPSGGGVALDGQYADEFGVSFGPGASVHTCQSSEFSATTAFTSLCPYSQAASGRRAALHEPRSGGRAMTINFAQAVSYLSMKINPTGGTQDERFIAQINGFNTSGERVATNSIDFQWFQDAFTWPTSLELETDDARVARVTIELRRPSQNNQPVRFLIDDLELVYAEELSDAPVISALQEEQRPPRIANQETVQSSRDKEVQDELRLYPAATRIRTQIDWDAVDVTLGQQKDRNISAAPASMDNVSDIAELPLILPARADAGSVSIVGGKDNYHASFERGGRAYSLYGTRVLSVIKPAAGAPSPTRNLNIIESDYALIATFSLYGASYTLTGYCLNDSAEEDADCHDGDALGEVAMEMAVVVGASGEGRP
ncbi:MAG: hypothetical protein DHS20C05_00770 [Hyphococcus sp.]|nr:MAG: hypothetical protein DHS20C05_00770 [Marinicaulis sp.]